MPRSESLTRKKLDCLLGSPDTRRVELPGIRLALISDTHLGNGRAADDFRENEQALSGALAYYASRKFVLVLLGDFEELWQFSRGQVANRYRGSIYSRIKDFGPGGVLRIAGNHDCSWLHSRRLPPPKEALARPSMAAILDPGEGLPPILLAHGHQGSLMSDVLWRLSQPFVWLYSQLEGFMFSESLLGLSRRYPTVRAGVRKDFELLLYSWAVDRRVMLVTGHSHRAVFMSQSYSERLRSRLEAWRKAREHRSVLESSDTGLLLESRIASAEEELAREEARDGVNAPVGSNSVPCFFNTGCGLYAQGMTALEIDAAHQGSWRITLAKWSRSGSRKAYREANLKKLLQCCAKPANPNPAALAPGSRAARGSQGAERSGHLSEAEPQPIR